MVVIVEIWNKNQLFRKYAMNHDCPTEKRVLGEQVRNAFEGGQKVITYPRGK